MFYNIFLHEYELATPRHQKDEVEIFLHRLRFEPTQC